MKIIKDWSSSGLTKYIKDNYEVEFTDQGMCEVMAEHTRLKNKNNTALFNQAVKNIIETYSGQ